MRARSHSHALSRALSLLVSFLSSPLLSSPLLFLSLSLLHLSLSLPPSLPLCLTHKVEQLEVELLKLKHKQHFPSSTAHSNGVR